MNEVFLKVKLLIDILDKKIELLTQILNITENQELVLLAPEAQDGLSALFSGMNAEKQSLISNVINSDTVFQNTFESIADSIEHFSQTNKEVVALLQKKIKATMDLDIKIRIMERRNKEYIEKSKKNKKFFLPKASKSYILKQYKSQNDFPKK